MSFSSHLSIFFPAFLLIMAIMFGLWLISRKINDPSFIDAFWPTGFVILTWVGFWQSGEGATPAIALPLLVSIWGMRLGSHLFDRWCDHGIDPRYEKLLEGQMDPHWFSLWFVFGLQGLLILFIGWPLLVAPFYGGLIGWLSLPGLLLFVTGIFFEAVGDRQLKAFRADPANAGKVLDTGLWRYTRHPNYFGDAALWWGFWLIAVDLGTPLLSAICPLLMTWLLMRWSGVPLLEKSLKTNRPGYADYMARTSAFFPLPPKS